MSSFSFVADTNFLINVHEGLEKTEPFLDGTAIVSVISEIELLGWHLLKEDDKRSLELLLDDCVIIELNNEIKTIAISLRQQFKVKTPDAIIAATSKFLQLPLVTSDKGFKSIPDIELILI
ncbi:type II toxin-antitoxin system VapC family toxin [Pedobacter agri]|uniref:type II toxin-antitoxin system VapC family toxin n=1 Tax=Pedobacter agri TaxID=454586 RepID=UPI00292DA623|nr:type II toxin-antitoxin system VapC family toxin [Pedobacter agri]